MELTLLDLFSLIPDPSQAVYALALSVIMYQGYRLFSSIFKPVSYVEKLYDLTDEIVERADNSVIDRIRNTKVRNDMNKELKEVLIKRKQKIDDLIERLSD